MLNKKMQQQPFIVIAFSIKPFIRKQQTILGKEEPEELTPRVTARAERSVDEIIASLKAAREKPSVIVILCYFV